MMKEFWLRSLAISVLGLLLTTSPCLAQTIFVGMGDSIGQGVQSGDASAQTQQASYLNWVAAKLSVPFPLPVIQSGPFGFVGNVTNRTRLFPDNAGLNLAVSGASTHDLLHTQADAASISEIDTETDLVLYPRQGSQIQIAEALNPAVIVCWIGNNDVLGAVTAFDQLDASQITPVPDFESRFLELTDRLGALDSAVIYANIPDVTSIAILLDGDDLERLTGSRFGLLEGDFTTLPTAMLIRLGVLDGSVLQDPNYVLDATELAIIQQRIDAFNGIIAQAAASHNAPLVNVNGIFANFVANPPTLLGIPLTHRFLGGLFSLDGVHPSNIGHVIIGDQVIAAMNAFYGTSFPRLTAPEFHQVLLNDPFWDKDRDGKAVGRPFSSLIETLGVLTNLSGDPDDLDPTASLQAPSQLSSTSGGDRGALLASLGLTPGSDREAAIRLLKTIWRAPPR